MEIDEFMTTFAPGPSPDPELEELLTNLPEITMTADDLKRAEISLYPDIVCFFFFILLGAYTNESISETRI